MRPSTVMIQGSAKAFIECDLGSSAIFTRFEKEDGDSLFSTMCCRNQTDLISGSLSMSSSSFCGPNCAQILKCRPFCAATFRRSPFCPTWVFAARRKPWERISRPQLLCLAHNASDLHNVLSETKANVKLVLAGHLHHLEEIRIDGISYINGGAICGNWWKGAQKGCPEGFMVLDLTARHAQIRPSLKRRRYQPYALESRFLKNLSGQRQNALNQSR